VSETRKPLTAKIAKKQREERKEKQRSCFATSALLFAIFAVKDFCEDDIELRTAWPGIVTGAALNLRLPTQSSAGQSIGF
jgi:hypothetical protein